MNRVIYLHRNHSKTEKMKNQTTEEKIIEAAGKVFSQKGYAATRNRDIAEEAGLNMALLNYYFRSKEKLFEIVMAENSKKFFSVILPIINDLDSTLMEKIELLTDNYIDLLVESPELPLFIFNEIKVDPNSFKGRVQVDMLFNASHFISQIREAIPEVEPLQFVISLFGMILFPFVSKPVFYTDEQKFRQQMIERKSYIITWAKAILKL